MANFCSRDDVKLNTKIGATFTGYDSVIDNCISLASSQVQNFCNRSFVEGVFTEYYHTIRPETLQRIWLKELNIKAIPALVIKLSYSNPYDWADVAPMSPSIYKIDSAKSIVTIFGTTAYAQDALQIVYSAGYPIVSGICQVPDDVKKATALQASYLLNSILARELGQSATKEGKNGTSRLDNDAVKGLVAQCRSMVANYRKLAIGCG